MSGIKFLLLAPVVACTVLASLVGCGGGGSPAASSGALGGPAGSSAAKVPSNATALFHVDLASGKVTVTPSAAGSTSRAVFSGSAVTFNSTVLLDQPGVSGLKSLSVSLTNNWGLPIGADPSGNANGLRVLFSNFTSLGAFANISTQSQVATIAGSGATGNTNGIASGASFNTPVGVAAAPGGVVYVAEYFGHTVRKIANNYVSTLAGKGVAGGVNGLGTAASFNTPYGVAVNPVDGAVIVTEVGGCRVRRITPAGRVTTIAGSGNAAEGDGTGTSASFYGPAGVTVSSNGTIFVADIFGNTIRKITFAGGDPTVPSNYSVLTIAGTSAAGSSDGIGSGAAFSSPTGIAVDPSGNLYVADANNNSVRRVSQAGEVVTIAGTGAASSNDGPGNVATFNAPRGVAYVNGGLMVSERLGNKIRQITVANNGLASTATASSFVVATLAGTGTSGGGNGSGSVATFNAPLLISADQSGDIYVGDSGNTIREVTPNSGVFPVGIPTGATPPIDPVSISNATGFIPIAAGGTPTAYITYPTTLAPGATSDAQNWNFIIPQGVTAFEFTATVEADSNALTPAQGAVGVGSPLVSVRTLTGSGPNIGYLNGPLTVALFNGPEYLTLDAAGDIFDGDYYNSTIRLISATGVVSTIAGNPNNQGFNDGTGDVAKFQNPAGVAVSQDGTTLFVADSGNQRIRRISFLGGDRTNPANWYVTTIVGTGTAGGNYSSTEQGNVATLNDPLGLAMDSGGNLYVSEFIGQRVRRVTFAGGDAAQATNYQVSLLAGNIGSISPTGGDTDASYANATFNRPAGLAVDSVGNVYVADENNDRIRVISNVGTVTTLAGGVSGDSPNNSYVDGVGAAAHFIAPVGVAMDSSGLLYVADSSDNHVRCITKAGTVTTLAGTGATGSIDGLGNVATFNNPASLAVTPSGTLYLGSTNDNSIRVIERIISKGTQ